MRDNGVLSMNIKDIEIDVDINPNIKYKHYRSVLKNDTIITGFWFEIEYPTKVKHIYKM